MENSVSSPMGASAGSQSTRRHYGQAIPTRICNCGITLPLKTSWTDQNPGRRWWGCNTCRFFEWFDPEMCPRSTSLIPGILRSKNKVEEENKRLKAIIKRSRRGYIAMVVVCSVVGFYLGTVYGGRNNHVCRGMLEGHKF